jgi:putative oxidoreductase
MDLGILVLRLLVGAYLFGHGTQKLFGWFGGPGMKGTQGFMGMLGFRPPILWALMAGMGETLGGLGLLVGLLNPLPSIAITSVMITAIFTAHRGKGLWNSNGGSELPLTNMAAVAAVAFAGPGRYSLDSLLGISLPEPLVAIVFCVGAALTLITGFAARAPQPAPQPQAA